MTGSLPQTTTLSLPAIEGMTIVFHGVNYLRPEKMLDSTTISQIPVRMITPLALLYSTVDVLRQVKLRKLSVYISGWVVHPISSLTTPGLHAKLITNVASQRLRFLENLVVSSPSDNARGMQTLSLALTSAVGQPV